LEKNRAPLAWARKIAGFPPINPSVPGRLFVL